MISHLDLETQEWEFEILYRICTNLKNIEPLTTVRFSLLLEYFN